MIRRALLGGLAALVGLAALSACGGGHNRATSSRPGSNRDITLTVRTTPELGSFLVADGWTLYMYPPDHQRSVTCTKVGDCLTAWPPLYLGAGHRVIAGPRVKPALIGTVAGDGGKVVTYNHWPLYYYIGDHKALDVNGQDQGFNWYVMAPNGTPTKTGPNGGPV